MPRVRALALVAALPIAALAACSNRPNDLYTYYDDPTGTAAVTSQTAVAAPVTTTARPVDTQRLREPGEVAALALMGKADLVAEEVQPDPASATAQTTLPDCAVDLGAGTARQSSWLYPSGARLRQVAVVSTETDQAADVVAAARSDLTCKTFKVAGVSFQVDKALTIAALPGVDDQLVWCATAAAKSSCTAVLAADRVVTAVTVEASTPARAKSAITRVAPKAAEVLTRGA
ncbi:hypothetical protein [Actinokineospora globicatena]|uniref:hypothetical protein n=1 Tax=Actinokineospora globicatena TaxID=103729 RepID=UPI0020A3D21A|nr:hypothetical protein [Actinokineospora globicatena]MCP2306639.1 hypothetical protein [Actinokineospora globicatena]GLW82244.1 hypothetical protein Aglo01_67250 [Actinokineospora globicatena]GLW89037.1 hypothetical protein Aglo02_66760 [Actinokineospora globicatena]